MIHRFTITEYNNASTCTHSQRLSKEIMRKIFFILNSWLNLCASSLCLFLLPSIAVTHSIFSSLTITLFPISSPYDCLTICLYISLISPSGLLFLTSIFPFSLFSLSTLLICPICLNLSVCHSLTLFLIYFIFLVCLFVF